MGLLKGISKLISGEEIDSSNEENETEIPFWMRGFGEIKEDESVEESKEKTEEEEKYLEGIFGGKKNEFNYIFPTNNQEQNNKSPKENLEKYIWLNFYMENYYLDDNVYIEKNIKTEIYLTDEEIKNGATKIIKYERNELIYKCNYIKDNESMEIQTVEYQKEIVIPPNVEEGTVYKFIGFGNCFEDIDEKIQCGDLYVFILGDDKNGNF